MSFSTEFTARSKNHALQLLETQKHHLPPPVSEFLVVAINNLPAPREGFTQAVAVKAQGHLCQGDGSYSVSNCQIEVRPIPIPD